MKLKAFTLAEVLIALVVLGVIAAMTIPNIIVLYILAPEIKKDLDDYCERHNLNYFGWVKDIKNIIKIKKA